MAQAEKTAGKARLAERLISGLAAEFQRWSKNIEDFTAAEGCPPFPFSSLHILCKQLPGHRKSQTPLYIAVYNKVESVAIVVV